MLALEKLAKAEIHWLYGFFATRHSVLGGDAPVADLAGAQHRAMMLIMPLGLLREFLEVCLFVVALAATKNLVCMTLDERKPDLTAALQEVLPRTREVLLFSLKYMLVLAAFGGAVILLGTSPLTPERIHEIFLSKGLNYVLVLVCQGCLAWLLLPAAIRLLRPPGNSAITSQERKLGVFFAVATSALSLALQSIVGKAESTVMLEKPWEGWTVAIVNTVIINAPEVLLFIALAQLATLNPSEKTVPAAESDAH
jgi:hypothetical protein